MNVSVTQNVINIFLFTKTTPDKCLISLSNVLTQQLSCKNYLGKKSYIQKMTNIEPKHEKLILILHQKYLVISGKYNCLQASI